jgi:cell division septal protein FtsQ
VLLTLAILAVPAAVYAWGRSSSSFDIAVMRVSGTQLVPAGKTLRLLKRTYVDQNLFTVTAGDVRRTLEPLSFVAGVSVDRAFPDTLEVAVAEYEPAAYALAGSRWYVLDEGGYVICTAAEAAKQLAGSARAAKAAKAAGSPEGGASASPAAQAAAGDAASETAVADGAPEQAGEKEGALTARLVAGPSAAPLPLPRITVEGRVREGETLDDEPTVQKLAVITALPDSYRRDLAAVEEREGQLTLRFAGGPVASWGDAGRTLAKTVALRTVLKRYEQVGKTCTMIDVSIPDRTLARPVLQ